MAARPVSSQSLECEFFFLCICTPLPFMSPGAEGRMETRKVLCLFRPRASPGTDTSAAVNVLFMLCSGSEGGREPATLRLLLKVGCVGLQAGTGVRSGCRDTPSHGLWDSNCALPIKTHLLLPVPCGRRQSAFIHSICVKTTLIKNLKLDEFNTQVHIRQQRWQSHLCSWFIFHHFNCISLSGAPGFHCTIQLIFFFNTC